MKPAQRWQPKKTHDGWIVVIPETPMYAEVVRLGGDGTPLRFWSERGAQIHADSLNPKVPMLDDI